MDSRAQNHPGGNINLPIISTRNWWKKTRGFSHQEPACSLRGSHSFHSGWLVPSEKQLDGPPVVSWSLLTYVTNVAVVWGITKIARLFKSEVQRKRKHQKASESIRTRLGSPFYSQFHCPFQYQVSQTTGSTARLAPTAAREKAASAAAHDLDTGKIGAKTIGFQGSTLFPEPHEHCSKSEMIFRKNDFESWGLKWNWLEMWPRYICSYTTH